MKKILFVYFIFVATTLFALDFKSVFSAYDVSYGILGNVGKAEATIEIEEGTYKIRMVAEGKGLAKFFSGNRKETYESTGIVKDGRFIPTLFVKDKTWGEKEERKRYFFDHAKKQVLVVKTSIKKGKIKESSERLAYYAENDILSLFFNLKSILGIKMETPKISLYAVGANRDNGMLEIETPKGEKAKEIAKLLGKEDNLLIVVLHQKVFSSKQGEFFLNINEDGLCDRVVLKDVVLYGDLLGKSKKSKIKR